MVSPGTSPPIAELIVSTAPRGAIGVTVSKSTFAAGAGGVYCWKKMLLVPVFKTTKRKLWRRLSVRPMRLGHDSHGVLRIPEYVRWIEEKLVTLGAHIKIRKETEAFALIDGNWGFGQVVAREAIRRTARCRRLQPE